MKQQLLLALMALGLSASAASAQAIPGLLPASEVAGIVRSAGFVPLSPVMRRGDSYVLRASARDGREMRLVVAGRSGEIVSASPVVAAAPGGDRLGPHERMDRPPPDYIPPPIVHESDHPMRRPLAGVPGAAPPRSARAAVPEAPDYLPPSDPPPSIMREEREERGEHGLLPPPPERFPPRAVAPPAAQPKPAAKPAPVKRAAATPLPRPRPDVEAAKPAGELKQWGDDASQPPAAAAAPAVPAAPAKVDPRSLPH